jgi:hypothetical protein
MDAVINTPVQAMRVTKLSPVFPVLLLVSAVGCAENKTARTENPSPAYVSTAAVTNAPPEQGLTPTSDRPDAQPHIYSNSPNQAVSPPSSSENP